MSVMDLMMSPMSVDKSAMGTSTANCSMATMKSERERFFEIEEYQCDILAYLKEAEVLTFCLIKKLNDRNLFIFSHQ